MKPRLASKSTRFSASTASAILLASLLVGCAAPGEVSVPDGGDGQGDATLETIAFDTRVPIERDLAIFNGEVGLRLGTTKDRAIEVFPALAKSYPFSALPAQFGKEFKAVGWEGDQISFGCITLPVDGKETVVLAMVTIEDASDDAVASALEKYKKEFGDPQFSLPGNRVIYHFWDRPGRRLMLNVSTSGSGHRSLTVVLGAPQAMTELGMSHERAKTDQTKALEGLSSQAAG